MISIISESWLISASSADEKTPELVDERQVHLTWRRVWCLSACSEWSSSSIERNILNLDVTGAEAPEVVESRLDAISESARFRIGHLSLDLLVSAAHLGKAGTLLRIITRCLQGIKQRDLARRFRDIVFESTTVTAMLTSEAGDHHRIGRSRAIFS